MLEALRTIATAIGSITLIGGSVVGVFIKPDLEEKFSKIAALMWAAVIDREVRGQENCDYYQEVANTKFRDEAPALIAEIKKAVQGNLWDSKAP